MVQFIMHWKPGMLPWFLINKKQGIKNSSIRPEINDILSLLSAEIIDGRTTGCPVISKEKEGSFPFSHKAVTS